MGSTSDTKRFWSFPPRKRLIIASAILLTVASLAPWLNQWNFFAPGGVLETSRPIPEFPDLTNREADGLWDGIDPVTVEMMEGEVWLFYIWTFG